MPAKRPQPLSPADMDMSDVPMTEAMQAMRLVSTAANDLKEVGRTLDDMINDGAELAWVERQQVQHILRAQGRPFSHRMSFRDKLLRRGLDTSVGFHAHRNREPIEVEDVADYLLDPELAEIAELARALRERIERHAEARAEQYPAQHARLLDKVQKRREQAEQAS
ncbi:hypothetical protein ABZS76_32635 [Streptomyces sp. NPDC005562]|uniref:hypothetical protein n=1 Tax=Streptomyces sp. NPDC005562 TaxID=3154890 RepID=UPI0033A2105B